MKRLERTLWPHKVLVFLVLGCAAGRPGLLVGPAWAGPLPRFRKGKPGQLAKLRLPRPDRFTTEDGKRGWRLKLPGGSRLATPAVVDGVVYIGGGPSSHAIYALDAATAEPIWAYATGDNGPTAAVVSEGRVVYSTESCTLYVHSAKTGKLLWSRWLGDPLMRQPATSGGRLSAASPGRGGSYRLVACGATTGRVLWDKPIATEVLSAPVVEGGSIVAATADGTLYNFDARTGRQIWSRKCHVTSAPRVVNGSVVISQRADRPIASVLGKDGKANATAALAIAEGLNVVDGRTGKFAHPEPQATVPAGYLVGRQQGRLLARANAGAAFNGQRACRALVGCVDELLFGGARSSQERRELRSRVARYLAQRASSGPGAAVQNAEEAMRLASSLHVAAARRSLEPAKRTALHRALGDLARTAQDTKEAARSAGAILSAHGLPSQVLAEAPDSARASRARYVSPISANVGKDGVRALWSFQGSRPCIYGSKVIAAFGHRVRSIYPEMGIVDWEATIPCRAAGDRPITPPALAGDKLYLGTADGRVVCVDAKTGKGLWDASVGGSIQCEPAVAGGSVYVGTAGGMLICLETGDPTADGWPMWGGSPGHNGSGEQTPNPDFPAIAYASAPPSAPRREEVKTKLSELRGRLVVGDPPEPKGLRFAEYLRLRARHSHPRCDRVLESSGKATATVAVVKRDRAGNWTWVARYALKRTREVDREFRLATPRARRAAAIAGVRFGITPREMFADKGQHYKVQKLDDPGTAAFIYDDVVVTVRDWDGDGSGRVVRISPTTQAVREAASHLPYVDR